MLSFTKSRSRTPAGPQNRNFSIVGLNSYFKQKLETQNVWRKNNFVSPNNDKIRQFLERRR